MDGPGYITQGIVNTCAKEGKCDAVLTTDYMFQLPNKMDHFRYKDESAKHIEIHLC